MSGYIPPFFKKIGKSVADLFKEQFEYKRQLKVKTSAPNLTLESGVESGKDGKVDGNVKATYNQHEIGTLEAELHTTGVTKYSVKADKVTPGLAVKVSGDEKPSGKVEVDYAQEFFASSVTADVSKASTAVEAAAVIGFDGLAVGGQVKYDVGHQQLADFNAAAEYGPKDFTVTVKTSESASKITTSYLHKLVDVQVAASLLYDIDANKRVATVGGTYKVDAATNTKLKVDTNGLLSLVWEHRPPTASFAKFVLASEFSSKSASTVPDKLGLALHLGDK